MTIASSPSSTSRPRSAGILLFRYAPGDEIEVLLIHPGGPFWRKKWAGAWQLPKGQVNPGEPVLAAARREFAEELGSIPNGEPTPLAIIRQAGGKIVEAFALEGDFNVDAISSNNFTIEWPPRSGNIESFPEVDAARWFNLNDAHTNILASQAILLDHLKILLCSQKNEDRV